MYIHFLIEIDEMDEKDTKLSLLVESLIRVMY